MHKLDHQDRSFISAKMRPSFIIFCVWCVIVQACNGVADGELEGFVVKRGNRSVLVSTENGEIKAARLGNATSSYLLHFITMDPNSLFLPVILHSDMVFYVHTGSGKLSWTEESEVKTSDIRRGDVYRLKAGAVFFIQSNLETETERQKLRIHSIFPNSNIDMHAPSTGPYSSIRDMVLGFDKKVLQAAFKVPEEVIEELLRGTKPPAIIHGVSRRAWEMEIEFLDSFLGSTSYNIFELKKKGKSSPKLFNIFKEDKDLKTRHGWSTTVTGKKLSALKGTNIGLFMVNLTSGSMMGPHWNPMAHEVGVVVRGRGMVHVVGSDVLNETGRGDMRFEVEEGDIFVVPRFHAMAQMAFNNETFVFMGFSSSAKKNHPQFLAGQASVLRTLSKDVLARSFNVGTTVMDRLLASQQDSIILGCISCAEEELKILEEAREREQEEAREEERRRKEEEEARQREEEEAKRREEEEEEAARRAEEEKERQEEEEAARQEEERRRREEEEEEEEAARRAREEEAAKQREEEEAARQEEERRRREEEEEEEEAARRAREEEAAKQREGEEAARQEEERRRREEEEEEAARRAREEEAAKQREGEEAARQEEERRRQEEEEAARRAEEERQEEEEAAKRREEEKRRREEEEEEAARRAEEEEAARQREQEEARRQEEQRRRREEEEEEEASRRAEEERTRQEEEEAAARRAEEERRRQEEERQRREEEEAHEEQWSEEEEAAEEERRREEGEQREEEAAARQHQEEGQRSIEE